MNREELVLADTWTAHYVATLPREHPQLYDPARPELALPHTVHVKWNALENAFQWTLPPGADHVHLPLAAEDVVRTKFTTDARAWRIGPEGVVELDPLPSPARQARLLVPLPETNRPLLLGPVTYRFEEGILTNGSWFEQGLRSYVGAIRMRQTFGCDHEPPPAAILGLSLVRAASVEAQLNGKPLGRRADGPSQFDLRGNLRRGSNELELLVRNAPGQDCGVFGPVTIRFPGSSSGR